MGLRYCRVKEGYVVSTAAAKCAILHAEVSHSRKVERSAGSTLPPQHSRKKENLGFFLFSEDLQLRLLT